MRDNTLSVLKWIGILLVVLGHVGLENTEGWSKGVHDFIYMFHMPLFFIASGYFFTASNIDFKFDFFKRKINSLYIPFVKWSLIFLLLHNAFFILGILNENYGWKGNGTRYYDIRTILVSIIFHS